MNKIIKVQIMQKVQDPLNLRSLPLADPPEDSWPAIEQALLDDRNRSRKRIRTAVTGTFAAAALVVLAVSVVIRVPGPEITTPPVEVVQTDAAADVVPSEADILNSLIKLSQQLEGQVQAKRKQLGAINGDALVYQVEMQDLIAMVDEELNQDPESIELWSQRVNLLLDVKQLYQNQLRREYHNMASL